VLTELDVRPPVFSSILHLRSFLITFILHRHGGSGSSGWWFLEGEACCGIGLETASEEVHDFLMLFIVWAFMGGQCIYIIE